MNSIHFTVVFVWTKLYECALEIILWLAEFVVNLAMSVFTSFFERDNIQILYDITFKVLNKQEHPGSHSYNLLN